MFFLFPLLGSFARAQQPEPTAAEGIQLYQQGDLSGATRILLEVVKQHPDDAEAQYAARKIKFTPATKDVREVSQYIQLEYNFNLY